MGLQRDDRIAMELRRSSWKGCDKRSIATELLRGVLMSIAEEVRRPVPNRKGMESRLSELQWNCLDQQRLERQRDCRATRRQGTAGI